MQTHTCHMFVYKHDFSTLLSCTNLRPACDSNNVEKHKGPQQTHFEKNANLSNNYQKASHTKAGIERIVTEMLKMGGSYAIILNDRGRKIQGNKFWKTETQEMVPTETHP